MSNYLRRVGLGYGVKHVLDNRSVQVLAKINGDHGRLGGRLNLWLTDDPRTAEFEEATIRAVLSKIEHSQDEMLDVMRDAKDCPDQVGLLNAHERCHGRSCRLVSRPATHAARRSPCIMILAFKPR
jgi:hypothetical protein